MSLRLSSARPLAMVVALALLVPGPAVAAEPGGEGPVADTLLGAGVDTGVDTVADTLLDTVVDTDTTVSAPAGSAGESTRARVRLRTGAGAPVADARVVVERRRSGTWRELARPRTAADGTVATPMVLFRRSADNVVRASYAGGDPVPGGGTPSGGSDRAYGPSASGPVQVDLVRRASRLTLSGPDAVRDGERATLRLRRLTGEGVPVPGPAVVQRRTSSGWHPVASVRLGARGGARVVVRPRRDTRYRATAPRQDWVAADTSDAHRVRNRPPGSVVRLPAGAPAPRIGLPAQRRVGRAGANPVITRIPGAVWRSMTGRSWHRGCPVGRAGLRLLRVTYWGYDGYRHRGEMVVAAWAVRRAAGALSEMYRRGFPIRRMYRVDRFGWSKRVQGANDHRSMAAGNSSGFNCRSVVNKPWVRSPHAWGGSIDINTWENPYLSRTGWVPNRWWAYRAHARVAWRSTRHPVVRIWARHGFRWTYRVGDSQHFDAVRGNGRVLAPEGCTGYCH